MSRNAIRKALRCDRPPVYERAAAPRLDPFKAGIHRLLAQDPKLPGVRVRELLEPLGCTASKTVVDDYLREVRPLFAPPPRSFQRTVYRPGELVQFDVWQVKDEVAVGHGQTRRGGVVIACLGYSRAGAGMLVFSKETPDLLAGIAGCLQRLGGLPHSLVWDRQAGIHGHGGRPTEAFAAFCGQLKCGGVFCEPADPQAKGAVERLQGYAETNFEPGRRFGNHIDFQDQLDAWFDKVNARTHKALRARPVDRLAEELEVMTRLPEAMPDTAFPRSDARSRSTASAGPRTSVRSTARTCGQAGAELVREAHAGSKTTSVKVTGVAVAFRYACRRAASNQAL